MSAHSAVVSEPERLWIGGEWREASDGKTFPTYNPATGEVLAWVPEASAADVDGSHARPARAQSANAGHHR